MQLLIRSDCGIGSSVFFVGPALLLLFLELVVNLLNPFANNSRSVRIQLLSRNIKFAQNFLIDTDLNRFTLRVIRFRTPHLLEDIAPPFRPDNNILLSGRKVNYSCNFICRLPASAFKKNPNQNIMTGVL